MSWIEFSRKEVFCEALKLIAFGVAAFVMFTLLAMAVSPSEPKDHRPIPNKVVITEQPLTIKFHKKLDQIMEALP